MKLALLCIIVFADGIYEWTGDQSDSYLFQSGTFVEGRIVKINHAYQGSSKLRPNDDSYLKGEVVVEFTIPRAINIALPCPTAALGINPLD